MGQIVDKHVLEAILDKNGTSKSSIISILQDIQEKYRYIPEEVFPYLAEKLDMSTAKIYGVATFMKTFH